MTIATKLTLAVVALLIVAMGVVLLAPGCHRDDTPQVVGTVDTVPDRVLTAERPKPPATFGQRITRHKVPAKISVSRGTPDTVRVSWYADAAHEADSLRHLVDSLRRGDSTDQARAARVAKPRPLLPPVSGRYRKDQLSLWITRADGSLMRATAKLHPTFEFYMGQDGPTDTIPVFSEERAWVRTLRQAVKCAPPTAVVAGLGALVNHSDRVLGAIVAGGSTLLGCLVG